MKQQPVNNLKTTKMISGILHINLSKLFSKFRSSQELVMRAARGGIWIGGGDFAANGARFIRNVILTRLLAPEAFGIMAIILAINAAFESLTQIGINNVIIQNPRSLEKTFLNRAWWISIVRGVLLYLFIFIAAPWIGNFYENTELTGLLRVCLLSVLFTASISPRTYIEIKKMHYKKWAAINYGSTFIGVSAAICSGFFIHNVWALVIGFTTEAATRCLLSHVLCPFRPGLSFDIESTQAISKYIRGYLGLPIMTLIFNQTDILVIGKLCSSSDLGLYNMAITLAQMPALIMAALMGHIGMPAFAEIQTDINKINQAVIGITSVVVALGMPAMLFAMFYGRDLLSIIYGPIYGSVAIPFAIVLLRSMVQIVGNPIVALYFAIGRPELNRRFTTIRAIAILVLIYPAIKHFSLIGAAMAGLIAMLVGYIIQIVNLYSITKFDFRKYCAVFLRILACSFFIPIIWVITNILDLNPFLNIVIGMIGIFLSYGLYLIIFREFNTASSEA